MKKNLLIFAVIVSSLISIQATTINNEEKIEEVYATCSGNFNIDGDSYTITLHDVSWWTCVKFKVGSWFQ
jgi:hypothetical protein|tara:strand:- start:254 stop:463 length:210 start_codon:yes stop_codon:yes gene_type:complete